MAPASTHCRNAFGSAAQGAASGADHEVASISTDEGERLEAHGHFRQHYTPAASRRELHHSTRSGLRHSLYEGVAVGEQLRLDARAHPGASGAVMCPSFGTGA